MARGEQPVTTGPLERRAIRAVIFDFDGTLTIPGGLDFDDLRTRMGCPASESILDFLARLSDAGDRRRAESILEDAEANAAAEALPNAGAEEFVELLKRRGIPRAILTRNSRQSVLRSLRNFPALSETDFDLIVSRDDDVRYKPHPDGVLFAAQRLGVAVTEVAVIGDFLYDMQAARAAGAFAIYMPPPDAPAGDATPCDARALSFDELRVLLDPMLPLAPGKVPNRLLARCLSHLPVADDAVGPGVGEDTGAVEMDAGMLVLKSDPVTFVTDRIGYYALTVNANDIATSGADPLGVVVTLLFPPGTTGFEVEDVFEDFGAEARRLGLVVAGGHTEITPSVTRTVAVVSMFGAVDRKRLLRKQAAREGDIILLTKSAGIEGTSIIAAEYGSRLRDAGIVEDDIGRAAAFSELMSIVPEARSVRELPGVVALHDATEGGVASAVRELAEATGRRMEVDASAIPVHAVTSLVCGAVSIDPLGLIGSGALIIIARPDSVDAVVNAVRSIDVPITAIGRVGAAIASVSSRDSPGAASGRSVQIGSDPAEGLPVFEVDEITRLSR